MTPAHDVEALQGTSRPWTPEAAMEPLPPLAPPPAPPGAGRLVAPEVRASTTGGTPRVVLALLLLAVAVVVVLLAVLRP